MENRIFAGLPPALHDARQVSPALHGWIHDWMAWPNSAQAQAAVRRWQGLSLVMAPLADLDQVLGGCGGDSSVEALLANRRLLFRAGLSQPHLQLLIELGGTG